MRTLTPSEIVYFHPARFARTKKLVDAIALPHTDAKYDASELAEAILAAALVHADDNGAIRLAPAKASRLLGLRKVDVLEAHAGPKADAFPPGTIEARLRAIVADRPHEVQRLTHDLLADDSTYPELIPIHHVQQGLIEAGLLETTPSKRLGIFHVESIQVPDTTRTIAAQADAAPIQAQLDLWRSSRSADWELLVKGIRKGIASRKETSDGPD